MMNANVRRESLSSASSSASSSQSDDDSPPIWRARERRRLGAGILQRLRAARGSTRDSDTSSGYSKKNERVLDVLQTLRVRTSAQSQSITETFMDDATMTSAETPSLASTTVSSHWSMHSNQNSVHFGANGAMCRIRPQEHGMPSLPSASLSFYRPASRLPVKVMVDARKNMLPPLFDAVNSGAPLHVVRRVLANDSMAPWCQNNACMTALHCSIERYDTGLDVLLLLLAANPGAAGVRCNKGFNCVDLLWKRFLEPDDYRSEATKQRAAVLRQRMEYAAGSNFSENRQSLAHHTLQEDVDLREVWETIVPFIRGAVSYRPADPMTYQPPASALLVHNCVAIDCHPLLIRFASALSPDEIQVEMDDQGRLPLHVAATKSARATREVLSLFPLAASRFDCHGRLPLHYAIEKGLLWTNAIRDLTGASPLSFKAKDPVLELPPCLAAACSDSPDPTTIFCLLLANPVEVMNCALLSPG